MKKALRQRLDALTAAAPLPFDLPLWCVKASLREWDSTTELLRDVPERYHAAALLFWLSEGQPDEQQLCAFQRG